MNRKAFRLTIDDEQGIQHRQLAEAAPYIDFANYELQHHYPLPNGDLIVKRFGNRMTTLLSWVDPFLEQVLRPRWADWSESLRRNRLTFQRVSKSPIGTKTSTAVFIPNVISHEVWSENHNYVGEIQTLDDGGFQLRVFRMSRLLPDWCWQLVLTIAIYLTMIGMIQAASVIALRTKRSFRQQTRSIT